MSLVNNLNKQRIIRYAGPSEGIQKAHKSKLMIMYNLLLCNYI